MSDSSNISSDSPTADAVLLALGDARTLGFIPIDGEPNSLSTPHARGDDTTAAPSARGIPGYQLVREIHRGGQGIVYQALRSATGEDVAIKLLHERAAARRGDIERFEREAAVLRELNHPNIIAITEVGASRDGRPYIVMPYIPGWPLDEYARRNALPQRDVLELFARTCDAINAAHLNGVIHRDIKPGNIRVDDDGAPHVLDFGLARSVADLEPSLTQTGQFVGSFPWASPEQADPSLGRVDLRTDVYSLGALLYFLLTGVHPIDPTGSTREVLNRIVNQEPPPPSRYRSPGRARRDGGAERIDRTLDAIVLKCIAKDRTRRYQNAGEISADLGRYLRGDLVEARRDSVAYVVQKFARKNWPLLSLGVAVLLFGVAMNLRNAKLYQDERIARLAAQGAQAAAESARERAEISERRKTAALAALSRIQTQFDETNRKSAGYEPACEFLAGFVTNYESSPIPDPYVDCEVRLLLSAMHAGISDRPAADEQARLALATARRVAPSDEPLLGRALVNAAGAAMAVDDIPAALACAREAVELAHRHHGDNSTEFVEALASLARVLRRVGDLDAVNRAEQELLAVAGQGSNLQCAPIYRAAAERLCDQEGRFAESIVLHERAVSLARATFPSDKAWIAHYLHSFGNALNKAEALERAEAISREALALRSQAYAPDDVEYYYTFVTKGMLGEILTKRGKFAEAESLLRDAFNGFWATTHTRWMDKNDELVRRTAERLVRLYELWDAAPPETGRAEAAAEWRRRLDELRPAASP